MKYQQTHHHHHHYYSSSYSSSPSSVAILLFLILCYANFNTSNGIHFKTSAAVVVSSQVSSNLNFRGGSQSNAEEEEVDAEEEESTMTYELATKLRLEGKEFHDKGDFVQAAELFQQAADSLQTYEEEKEKEKLKQSYDDEDDHQTETTPPSLSEDYATCRLHQALCHLKSQDYQRCLDACTSIIQDQTEQNAAAAAAGGSLKLAINTPAVRARAYHRRAKAKLGLGDTTGALQDARSAAFLGDRKAVALYGKLMRDPASSSSSTEQNTFQSILSQQSSSSSSSPSVNSALMESLLSKTRPSSSNTDSSNASPFSPASLLMGNSNGGKGLLGALGSGSSGSSSLAKSVIKSLSKRLDDEQTQTTISNYLQNTNKSQLQQLAAMAGMSNALQDPQLDKIVQVCHGVTPKTIKRTVKNTKRAIYGFQIISRAARIVKKYRSFLVGIIILQWAKSACLRPIPINKAAAKKAAKQALKGAMKASRK